VPAVSDSSPLILSSRIGRLDLLAAQEFAPILRIPSAAIDACPDRA